VQKIFERSSTFLVVIWPLATAGFFAMCGVAGAQPVTVSNSLTRIRLEATRGTLAEITDLKSGHNFVGPSPDGLWSIQLAGGDKPAEVVPSHAGRFSSVALPGGAMGYELTWSGFSNSAPSDLRVRVTVGIPQGEAVSRWRIAVEGLGTNAVRRVRFPIIDNIPVQDGERLAVPSWMGQLAQEPRRQLTRRDGSGVHSEWHYPGELSLQCLALYGQKAGLYLACDDTESFRKSMGAVGGGGTNLTLEVVHSPEAKAADTWVQPYDVIMGTFQGDWFTAAERYRAWGTNQLWAQESRLARGQVADWVTNTALWVWNRGRSESVLKPAAALRGRLNLPVSVLWHWWHGCAYDTGFPEYLPPREGTDSFTQAVAKAKDQGVNSLVYMNQRLWGMTTKSWTNEGVEKWAVKTPSGKIQPEVYNTFTKQPCAAVCLGTSFWRNKYASLAEEALQLGVGGIYMDQACLSLACYDPAHGHPIGGGTYWVDGFKRLSEDIRRRSSGRNQSTLNGVALAGEGCGEPWLRHLDLMLSLQVSRERYAAPDGWETIPFFHAVYHPYAVLFGNYSSLTMPPYDELWPAKTAPKEPLKPLDRAFSTQFYLEQARAFVWGQQPMIANFLPSQFETRAEEIDYVVGLSRARSQALKYMLGGTMLRAPMLEVPERNIPMSRLSIYAGQQGGLTQFEKRVPLAVVSAWRANDGTVALALASISDAPVKTILRVSPRDYGLSGAVKLVRIGDGATVGKGVDGENSFEIDLPSRAAWVLELKLD
jgi:hypothetical protein